MTTATDNGNDLQACGSRIITCDEFRQCLTLRPRIAVAVTWPPDVGSTLPSALDPSERRICPSIWQSPTANGSACQGRFPSRCRSWLLTGSTEPVIHKAVRSLRDAGGVSTSDHMVKMEDLDQLNSVASPLHDGGEPSCLAQP